jgi:hypothetical protein
MVVVVGDARAALAAHGAVVVRVSTGSMQPTLPVGESVTVLARTAQLGDVVLLSARGALTLHRLVARVGLGPFVRWVHAGDAPGAAGWLCRDDQILGVAELPGRTLPLGDQLLLGAQAIARGLLAKLRAKLR